VKLNIYLLRESIKDDSNIILAKYLGEDGFLEIEPKSKPPFTCQAWIQFNKGKQPKWLEWLSSGFDLSTYQLMNQSNSFIIILEEEDRKFVVTFGYGFSAIDRAVVESDFGFKVTLNAIKPDSIDTIDARTIDRVTRQKKIYLNVGRSVQEFGIETDVDWLRSVRGVAKCGQIDGKMCGTDAVKIVWNGQFESLGKCCSKLLELYKSDSYKKHFGFVDHFRPLDTNHPLLKELEENVVQMLEDGNSDWLAVAQTEIPSEDIETYKIWSGKVKIEDIDELDLISVKNFIALYEAEKGTKPDLKKASVIGLDAQGDARSRKTSVWKYLVAHVEYVENVYVLSLGRWFQTDRDYLDNLRQKVAAIQDITAAINPLDWETGMTEEEYNRKLADDRGWLLLDRKVYLLKDRGDYKIECADILTDSQDFIHVKSMTSSATLSHLFAQGAISARLFRIDNEYRNKVSDDFRNHYQKALNYNHSDSRVVFAIASQKKGNIADILFFFSLVNLVQHKDMLDAMNWPMAICRIHKE